jgi:hypothetical protein
MSRKIILISVVLALLLTACGGKTTNTTALPADNNSAEATAAPQEVNTNSSSSSDDLSSALNLLLGTTDQPGVFDSYHMEMVLDTPKANDDDTAVVNEVVSISADVAGKNIHIFQIDPGMTEAKEGYIIGDNNTEFKLVDGAWEQTMGQIALGWAMWPLQVVVPFATISSLYAHKTGSEEVNGRPANVYELNTSKADPATLAGMQAVGVNITGKGQVWIDKKTGAMLKLDLEYTNDILTGDASKVIGSGNGHITIEISKVGEVTVTSPQ